MRKALVVTALATFSFCTAPNPGDWEFNELQAQEPPILIRKCGAPTVTFEKVTALDKDLLKYGLSRAARPKGSLTVRTYFHVIIGKNSVGNVSEDRLQAQLDVLNAAYKNTAFKFKLGGVTRTVREEWYSPTPGSRAEASLKSNLRLGIQKDLNIYTARLGGGLLGWATFPWDSSNLKQDGVVILNSAIPGGTAANYNLGDTLVHEVGHWLGLYHTFQGGCGRTGDGVIDTPAEREPAYSCNLSRDTCKDAGYDPVTNYMDYTDDACMSSFTQKQAEKMDLMASRYRGL